MKISFSDGIAITVAKSLISTVNACGTDLTDWEKERITE